MWVEIAVVLCPALTRGGLTFGCHRRLASARSRSRARCQWHPFLLLLLIAGCSCGREAGEPQKVEDYGKLPGLEATRDPVLIDEYARVKEQGGTPEQLDDTDVKDIDNAAAVLIGQIAKGRIDPLLDHVESLFPPGEFVFDAKTMQHAAALVRQWDEQRRAVREALARPECDLGIEYTAGYAADVKIVDIVRILARLEAFAIAEHLADNHLKSAIDTLDIYFRLVDCLAQSPHLDARLHAAYLRTDGFRILAAIVTRPSIDRSQVERLYKIVQRQLDNWPEDARAWIGERALGLHAYEMVRDGKVLDLMTVEEMEAFEKDKLDKSLVANTRQTVDADEAFYMQAMRQVIESCEKPYHERQKILKQINLELQKRWDSPEYPIVAGRLLLKDLERAQLVQARDRANAEAWALALAAALGAPPPEFKLSPVTGKPYRVQRKEDRIEVSGIGDAAGKQIPVWVPVMNGL